tara:strand:+ start:214 stop:426 length:213 start_codon:yes stop_codon:yes gene_type:complete
MAVKKQKQKVTPLYEDTNRVDLDLDDSVILQLAMQAHRENITLNQHINNIIREQLPEVEKGEAQLLTEVK